MSGVERDPLAHAVASLRAAISLLKADGKKAAGSDRMFAQMLIDYERAADRAAEVLITPTQPLEAATIERCAQVAETVRLEGYASIPGERQRAQHRVDTAAAIRALNAASHTTRGEDARLREALERHDNVMRHLRDAMNDSETIGSNEVKLTEEHAAQLNADVDVWEAEA